MIHGISWLREVGLGSISCRRMQRTSWNHSLLLCNQTLETHWRFWFSFQHRHEDSMQSCLLDNTKIFAGIISVFRLTESDDVWRVQLQLMEAREINHPVFQNENLGIGILAEWDLRLHTSFQDTQPQQHRFWFQIGWVRISRVQCSIEILVWYSECMLYCPRQRSGNYESRAPADAGF